MLKNILNLKGAQQLSENEQQSINGGAGGCHSFSWPTPSCVCDLPNGNCLYVNAGTICYDGSTAICL